MWPTPARQFKKKCFFYSPTLSFSIRPLLFHIFFIHPISHSSSFSISPFPFSPSLSLRYIHFTCARLSLSFLIAHSAPSFLSFRPIPVFSLLVATSESRHHFSFSCTLTPEFPQSYTSHPPSYIWILWFSPFFLASLRFCPFHSAQHSSIFFLLLIIPLLHWHTRFSDSISLSPSSPYFFLFSIIPLVFCTLPFHPFCVQTLPLSFPLSLWAYLSSLCNLAFLCPLLAPLSNIFLPLSLPLLVPSIPDLCPVHEYTLSHAVTLLLWNILTPKELTFCP
jgi:hypothetical protein